MNLEICLLIVVICTILSLGLCWVAACVVNPVIVSYLLVSIGILFIGEIVFGVIACYKAKC